MAFREADVGRDDGRGVVWRWLREFLLEDWGLKLLALIITLVLWFAVTGQRTPATINLRGVQLEFLRPSDIEISNEPLDEVSVTLEGSRGQLDEINARNLVARIDISQLKPGERVLHLTQQNVTMDLPDTVRIVRIEPRSVALRLERSVERALEVDVRLEGRPTEGFERRGVQVTPARVRVRGPESRVNALEKAYTETISLDGQRETLTLPQVAVDITDRKIIPLDPVVAVRVEIGEVQEERRIQGVDVRAPLGIEVRPTNVVVVVNGPRSLIERLRPEEISVVVEQAADGSLSPRATLPPALAGRVTVVAIIPTEFTIPK